ncbi:MAG TPA: hypothetical protein VKH44_05365, partial [Pirellulaceae bacterium]|nr:hypothetical protein [Pirellulaceae bacterium]
MIHSAVGSFNRDPEKTDDNGSMAGLAAQTIEPGRLDPLLTAMFSAIFGGERVFCKRYALLCGHFCQNRQAPVFRI